MDNMIKKFNEELKYCFPESRLEVVLLKTSLSESKGIDIRGDLNVMEFYKFLNFNKIWITENLQKYFHVETGKITMSIRRKQAWVLSQRLPLRMRKLKKEVA